MLKRWNVDVVPTVHRCTTPIRTTMRSFASVESASEAGRVLRERGVAPGAARGGPAIDSRMTVVVGLDDATLAGSKNREDSMS
jgi:hypothetical protein